MPISTYMRHAIGMTWRVGSGRVSIFVWSGGSGRVDNPAGRSGQEKLTRGELWVGIRATIYQPWLSPLVIVQIRNR